MQKDIAGYDMEYSEFKKICRKAWSEKFNYLCFEMTKNKKKVKYRISMKAKSYKLNAFQKLKILVF